MIGGVLAGLILYLVVAEPPLHDSPPRVNHEAYRFYVAGGLFAVGSEGGGKPKEAFEALFGHKGKYWVRIRTLGDAKGLVRIESGEDALEFVRLRTSRRTFYLLEDALQGEICSREWVASDWTYGDDHLARSMLSMREGRFGVLDGKTAKTWDLEPPQARRIGSRFQIERLVIRPEPGDPFRLTACKIRETVTEEGDYVCRYEQAPGWTKAVVWLPILFY